MESNEKEQFVRHLIHNESTGEKTEHVHRPARTASLARESWEGRVLLHARPLNNETILVREECALVDFAYHAAVHKHFVL